MVATCHFGHDALQRLAIRQQPGKAQIELIASGAEISQGGFEGRTPAGGISVVTLSLRHDR